MAATDPDLRRRNAIDAITTLWAGKTPEQRQAHMAKCADGLRRRFEQEVDPHGLLDPAERDRQVTLKRKRMLAAARAKGTANLIANAADRRRRKSDDEFAEIVAAVFDLAAQFLIEA